VAPPPSEPHKRAPISAGCKEWAWKSASGSELDVEARRHESGASPGGLTRREWPIGSAGATSAAAASMQLGGPKQVALCVFQAP